MRDRMDRNLRYHRLPSEEDPNHTVGSETEPEMTEEVNSLNTPSNSNAITENRDVSSTSSIEVHVAIGAEAQTALSPPPYSTCVGNSEESNDADAEAPKYDPSSPPSYSVAAVLPTYEQVEQLKRQEVIQEIVPIDSETVERGDTLLGTDFMFLCAFFVSFLFNWIGFLLLMCFCPTIAGRYGALAGFGLSLAKWTLIVKHSTEIISMDNNWLWWLILAFGVLICVRAVLQYLNVKREWHMLTRASQQRLMYFY